MEETENMCDKRPIKKASSGRLRFDGGRRSKELSRCLICDDIVESHHGFNILYTILPRSGTLLCDNINAVLQRNLDAVTARSNIVCNRCFSLFDELNAAQERCIEIRKEVRQYYVDTARIYDDEEPIELTGVACQTDVQDGLCGCQSVFCCTAINNDDNQQQHMTTNRNNIKLKISMLPKRRKNQPRKVNTSARKMKQKSSSQSCHQIKSSKVDLITSSDKKKFRRKSTRSDGDIEQLENVSLDERIRSKATANGLPGHNQNQTYSGYGSSNESNCNYNDGGNYDDDDSNGDEFIGDIVDESDQVRVKEELDDLLDADVDVFSQDIFNCDDDFEWKEETSGNLVSFLSKPTYSSGKSGGGRKRGKQRHIIADKDEAEEEDEEEKKENCEEKGEDEEEEGEARNQAGGVKLENELDDIQNMALSDNEQEREEKKMRKRQRSDRRGERAFLVPVHECEQCGKKWRTLTELKSHVQSHSEIRPFVCEICGQAYKLKKALDIHIGMHNGIHPFVCEYCNKSFTQKVGLEKHLPIHTGVTRFQCDLCGKRFIHQKSFNIHKMTHTGEKNIHCPICNLAVFSQSHLKRHYRVHTGERPYGCEICGKKFAEKYNLNAHIRIHDPTTAAEGRKRCHTCPICGVIYERKHKLMDHLSTAHCIWTTQELKSTGGDYYLESQHHLLQQQEMHDGGHMTPVHEQHHHLAGHDTNHHQQQQILSAALQQHQQQQQCQLQSTVVTQQQQQDSLQMAQTSVNLQHLSQLQQLPTIHNQSTIATAPHHALISPVATSHSSLSQQQQQQQHRHHLQQTSPSSSHGILSMPLPVTAGGNTDALSSPSLQSISSVFQLVTLPPPTVSSSHHPHNTMTSIANNSIPVAPI